MISHLSQTEHFAFSANMIPHSRHLLYTMDLPARGAPMPKCTVLKHVMQRCFWQVSHVWYSSPFLHISQVAKVDHALVYDTFFEHLSQYFSIVVMPSPTSKLASTVARFSQVMQYFGFLLAGLFANGFSFNRYFVILHPSPTGSP